MSVPFWFSLLGGIFLGICPLQFGCRIYWHQIFPIFFFAFHVCSICDDITFLILLQQSSLPPPLPHHSDWKFVNIICPFRKWSFFISFPPSLPSPFSFPFPSSLLSFSSPLLSLPPLPLDLGLEPSTLCTSLSQRTSFPLVLFSTSLLFLPYSVPCLLSIYGILIISFIKFF